MPPVAPPARMHRHAHIQVEQPISDRSSPGRLGVTSV